MPSEFPRSPKLLKGALVVFSSQKPGPPPTVIVCQYNPEQLSRSLAHRAAPPPPACAGAIVGQMADGAASKWRFSEYWVGRNSRFRQAFCQLRDASCWRSGMERSAIPPGRNR